MRNGEPGALRALQWLRCVLVLACCVVPEFARASDGPVERIAVLVASNDGGSDRAALAYSESDDAPRPRADRRCGSIRELRLAQERIPLQAPVMVLHEREQLGARRRDDDPSLERGMRC